jgi:hypothetical protein
MESDLDEGEYGHDVGHVRIQSAMRQTEEYGPTKEKLV